MQISLYPLEAMGAAKPESQMGGGGRLPGYAITGVPVRRFREKLDCRQWQLQRLEQKRIITPLGGRPAAVCAWPGSQVTVLEFLNSRGALNRTELMAILFHQRTLCKNADLLLHHVMPRGRCVRNVARLVTMLFQPDG